MTAFFEEFISYRKTGIEITINNHEVYIKHFNDEIKFLEGNAAYIPRECSFYYTKDDKVAGLRNILENHKALIKKLEEDLRYC